MVAGLVTYLPRLEVARGDKSALIADMLSLYCYTSGIVLEVVMVSNGELIERLISFIPTRICGLLCVIVAAVFLPWEITKGFRALWSTNRNVADNVWHWWVNGMKPSIRLMIKGR